MIKQPLRCPKCKKFCKSYSYEPNLTKLFNSNFGGYENRCQKCEDKVIKIVQEWMKNI